MNKPTHPILTKKQGWLFIAILVIYCITIHFNHFGEMPSGIHTWTQSDHYALARGFVENDLNFFRPQTLAYPYHYPATFNPANPSLVTAVDFPIHNYIPAVIMKITDSESPLIYQLYMLLISIVGLIYLFRLSLLINQSVTLSLLIVAFVAFSPVFTFYQIRFIPSVPSLCTTIIGLYYGMLYRQTKQIKHFAFGMFFFCLAAMTRLTLVIPFAAWLGQAFFDLFKETTDRKKRIFWMSFSVFLFLGSCGYNYYLRTEFGTLFLSKLMPATSLPHLLEITTYVIKTWKTDYLTKAHYLLIAFGIGYWIYNRIRNGKQRFFGTPNWFIFFLFSGSSAFYLLMCRQFPAHDYYFIDNFFVPVIVLLLFISRAIAPQTLLAKRIAFSFTGIFIVGMLFLNIKKQTFRHESERWGENNLINKNFEHSEELLNQLRIGKQEKLVILDRMAWNVPFYFMHRTGYVIMTVNKAKLNECLDLPVKYYVFQNETFLLNAYKMNPKIIERLKIIGTDGKITICEKTPPQKKSLFEFLQLENKNPVFERQLIDSLAVEWEIKGNQTDGNVFNVLASEEFGPVLKLRNSSWFKNYRVVFFSGQIKWNQQQDIECVTSFTENGELTTYKVFSVQASLKPTQNWQNFRFLITVPATQSSVNELSVYFWNTKKATYSVKDVSCKIY